MYSFCKTGDVVIFFEIVSDCLEEIDMGTHYAKITEVFIDSHVEEL